MNKFHTLLTILVLGAAICGCRTVKPVPQPERSVRIDVQTVIMDTADVSDISKGQILSPGRIESLRKDGKASLVTAEIITARVGQEAELKGVTECIYPTEFTESTPEEKKLKVTVNVVQETTVVPSSFATREVGHILTVTPVYQDRNRVCIKISRQSVQPPLWVSYPEGSMKSVISTNSAFRSQPVFRVAGTMTELVVKPGHPIVLSAHPQPNTEHKTFVTVLMVTLVD